MCNSVKALCFDLCDVVRQQLKTKCSEVYEVRGLASLLGVSSAKQGVISLSCHLKHGSVSEPVNFLCVVGCCMNEQVLDEEDLQECKLHVSSVLLSCNSGKKKKLTHFGTVLGCSKHANIFEVPEPTACITAF